MITPPTLLAKKYNFGSDGIMTLGDFLKTKQLTHKSSETRNHETRRVHFEYRPCADKTTYTLWYAEKGREVGVDVPKAVYDLYDLPSKHTDARFYPKERSQG
jgi:hypothetical protein